MKVSGNLILDRYRPRSGFFFTWAQGDEQKGIGLVRMPFTCKNRFPQSRETLGKRQAAKAGYSKKIVSK